MTAGQLGSLMGFVPFPSSSLWNTDISSAPVDSNSTKIINYIGSRVTLHPDFGSGTYANQTIGIPYQVVAGSQLKVNVKLGAYASESDPGPMPVTSKALIEGYPNPGNGDRHVLVLEKKRLLALRTVSRLPPEERTVERRFHRDLGHDYRRKAALHLDFSGRRRPADLRGTRTIR
jgi:hypothetical protein